MITMLKRSFKHLIILSALLPGVSTVNAQQSAFQWPKGIKAAISLSFDDARLSQVDVGTPLLDQYGIKATFVLVPSNAEKRIDKWKQAAANGHELGNHTLNHPCSGNFSWSKQNALENYTLKKMREELVETNRQLEHLLGVKATVFAYPCGSTYIGRGVKTKSYIPLIAKLFDAGRGWLNETPNDPSFCDFAQLTGMEMDGKDFDQLLPLIENSKKSGSWIILAGHEIGESGNQTTRVEMLKKLIAYAQDPANGIWIAPMGEIARYVKEQRATSN
ncbi:MAG: polysaccharide deacetylase family protein [Agriterribacter sp.]